MTGGAPPIAGATGLTPAQTSALAARAGRTPVDPAAVPCHHRLVHEKERVISSPPVVGPAPLTRGMRRLITFAIALAVTAGVSLYLLTGDTDRFFAWTIASPLTAAFLGAMYLGDIPQLVAARRERVWAYARQCAWGIFLFTAVSLVATANHLDKFHLAGPLGTATAAGWLWMAVYITLPVTTGWLLWQQSRVPGGEPPVTAPMSPGERAAYWAIAAGAGLLGATLLFAPGVNAWPWALTPLTSRAISARVLAMAGLAWLSARHGDRRQLTSGHGSLAVRGALALLAVARYPSEIDLGAPAGLAFVIACAVAAVAGTAAMRVSRLKEI